MRAQSSSNDGKNLKRQALRIEQLSDEEREAIAAAEVPAEYIHLDEELPLPPHLCHVRPSVENEQRPRKAGQMRGKIWIAKDFDAPDPEIEELFHGGHEP